MRPNDLWQRLAAAVHTLRVTAIRRAPGQHNLDGWCTVAWQVRRGSRWRAVTGNGLAAQLQRALDAITPL